MSYEDETRPLEQVREEAIATFVDKVMIKIRSAENTVAENGTCGPICLNLLTELDRLAIDQIEAISGIDDQSEVTARESGMNVAGTVWTLKRYKRNSKKRGLLVQEQKDITIPETRALPTSASALWDSASNHSYSIHIFKKNVQIYGDPFEYPLPEINNPILRRIINRRT